MPNESYGFKISNLSKIVQSWNKAFEGKIFPRSRVCLGSTLSNNF
jgi:hypothetical protein